MRPGRAGYAERMSSPYAPQTPPPGVPAAPPGHGAATVRPGDAAPAGRPGANPIGLAAALLGLAIVVVDVVMQFVRAALLAGDSPIDAIGTSSAIQGILVIVLALAALALGIVGLLLRGRSKLLAVVGVTLGGYALVAWVTSLLSNAMLAML